MTEAREDRRDGEHERAGGRAPAPYGVAPVRAAPALPGTVVVRDSVDELLDVAGTDLLLHARACVRAFGDFHMALSGGGTPLPLYQRLMVDPALREFPWQRTHLWVVDERRVPAGDERSNYTALDEIIVQHSGIPRAQAHPVAALEPDADARYERELREALEWRERGQDRLDYVLLGMGADAHTASLFPRSRAVREHPPGDARARLVTLNDGPHVTPPDRVTMTYRLINASRFIGVLVTGASKRDALARVAGAWRGVAAAGPVPVALVEEVPILGVRPMDGGGELRWYLDRDAAGA